jgi:hypothetical protein
MNIRKQFEMQAKLWLRTAGAVVAALMFAACANGPRNGGGAIAITGRLEAAPQDAPEMMTWAGAKQWCEDLAADGKNDWHLPTKEELNTLYENRNKLGIWFGVYWSSSESNDGRAWYQNFLFFGYQDYDDMNYGRVRAVRAF